MVVVVVVVAVVCRVGFINRDRMCSLGLARGSFEISGPRQDPRRNGTAIVFMAYVHATRGQL